MVWCSCPNFCIVKSQIGLPPDFHPVELWFEKEENMVDIWLFA